MAGSVTGAGTRARTRMELVGRVRERRAELEAAIMASIRDGAEEIEGQEDPEYMAGLRAAVAAAVEHGLEAVENGDEGGRPPPPQAISQARRAARAGVSVDTVLHRYVLGSTVLGDFLMREASRVEPADAPDALREMLGVQAGVLDRLLRRVAAEHRHETERAETSYERRRAEWVRRLLASGHCDLADFGYELAERRHLGVVAGGAGAQQALKRLAAELDAQLLCVPRGEDALWAWLGSRRPLAASEVDRALGPRDCLGDVCLALGEPGEGVEGWRTTHRQAQAAMRVALLRPRPLTRYADVALLASVLRDDGLARSFVDIYLTPLAQPGCDGAVLRDTLRTYFAAGCNAASAGSVLGVARHTVAKRLRFIEERLGLTLHARQAELEVALRLGELQEGAAEASKTSDPVWT